MKRPYPGALSLLTQDELEALRELMMWAFRMVNDPSNEMFRTINEPSDEMCSLQFFLRSLATEREGGIMWARMQQEARDGEVHSLEKIGELSFPVRSADFIKWRDRGPVFHVTIRAIDQAP